MSAQPPTPPLSPPDSVPACVLDEHGAAEQARDLYTPALIESLKLLQGIINRMATSSLEMKKFAIGVAGIGLVAAFTTQRWEVTPLLGMLMIVFWSLDTQYLRQERWFRTLYQRSVMTRNSQETLFMFTPTAEMRNSVRFSTVFFSWSTRWFYCALLLVLGLTGVFIAVKAAPTSSPALPSCLGF